MAAALLVIGRHNLKKENLIAWLDCCARSASRSLDCELRIKETRQPNGSVAKDYSEQDPCSTPPLLLLYAYRNYFSILSLRRQETVRLTYVANGA